MSGGTTSEQPRAWQRMLSGRRLDLLDPSPNDIAIEDIAHGLARVARWNGQTHGPHAFSVAQHSVLVVEIVTALEPRLSREARLAALLHDAPEYVIGDLISPFKAALGFDYKAFEGRLQAAIHARFSLPHPLLPSIKTAIKRADRIAAYHEATRLAGFDEGEGQLYFGPVETLTEALGAALARLQPLSVFEAETCFLDHFAQLTST